MNTRTTWFRHLGLVMALSLGGLVVTACTDSEAEGDVTAQDESHEDGEPYGISIRAGADVAFVLEVNGFSLSDKEAGQRALDSTPIQQEVLPGRNVVELTISTADIPVSEPLESVSAPMPESGFLQMMVERDRLVPTDVPGERMQVHDLVKQIEWEPDVVDGRIKLPQTLVLEFTAPDDHPVPIWSTADKRAVEAIEDDMIAVLRDIVSAFRSGDVNTVADLNQTAYEEFVTAYPYWAPVEKWREQDVEETRYFLGRPGAYVPDLVEPLTCRSVAREGLAKDRLFECLGEDGLGPVRILNPEDHPAYFNFQFSVIDGELRIVR